ncbi:ABC transporter substrate-binding protein [Pusillimonas noertemannii]|uniref:ABC-type branched-subunit amino acid transport system substrate-binding protein n=1 Tax=Pusillimonas noertemannii TaxID=305977 RepID=A0A2U1CQU2_9BURK|nr:ABC transporter substrate-binding protein [Pusillimonas noertemannii]NYT67598.1 ABC transporter substrate-binding protein [Pusillimonas noertemannii]PVY68270.1 ABC-type branched-subunit amino acid transport system substrate-binding protein [Pusillimonas noertemannii]
MKLKTSSLGVIASMVVMTSSIAHAQPSEPFVIGEVAALSGPAATVGTRLSQVSKMWSESINKAGGIDGRTVRLITCNDEGRPEKAVACARDLIAQGSQLLLAHTLTSSVRAIMPIVTNGPVMIVPSPNISPTPDSYVFQVSPTDAHLTKALARYLQENNVETLGMIAATDSSGEVGVISAKEIFPAEGIDLKIARIDLRSTDASSQLASVVGDDTKIVYSTYSGAGAATVVKSYYNLGLQQPLVVSYANLSTAFVDVVKDMLPPRLLGTSASSLVPELVTNPDNKQRAIAFTKAYEEKYGERPDMVNLISKLNVDTVEAVLRNVQDPSDAKAVKQYLQSHPIPSIHTLRFSPTSNVGLDEGDVVIVELKDGQWTKAGPLN